MRRIGPMWTALDPLADLRRRTGHTCANSYATVRVDAEGLLDWQHRATGRASIRKGG